MVGPASLTRDVRRCYAYRMNKCIYPCFLAMLLTPILIFLHECGHYLAASAFGARPEIHFAHVRIPGGHKTRMADFCSNAAGPLVDASFAIGGFLWLRHRLRSLPQTSPGLPNWIATIFVLRATGPIIGFVVALTGGPGIPDEAEMSLLLGLPGWLLPAVVALLALALILAAVRLLPRSYRLLPVASIYLGAFFAIVAQVAICYLSTGELPMIPVTK
jgi:hypothetical protein